ncbi:MAG: transporter substrate-binding domain-containing protein [Clostridiales bacterium]|nr:transporter substrate-binding domain-containing protein [Clostridiales bacterium]
MRTKTMKRIAIVIAAMLMAAMLAACTSGGGGGSSSAGDSDKDYIMGKGSITIGMTIFEPMNYWDEGTGNLIGFDTEFAEELCSRLGIDPIFEEINWDTKEIELAAKSIDAIWNGFTVTEERRENVLFSDPYVRNMQVVVIREADKDIKTDITSLANSIIAAEKSSAGADAIMAHPIQGGAGLVEVGKQTDALMEVKAGTADAAVLDYTLARAMIGPGTSYDDLMMMEDSALQIEDYAIGFRLGSDFVAEVNRVMAEMIADGTLGAIAQKYDLYDSLIANQ